MKPKDEKKGKSQVEFEIGPEGHKIKFDVVSDDIAFAELAKGAPLVCSRVEGHEVPVGIFADNKIGECVACGVKIYYRPYNELATRKMCLECVVEMAKGTENPS